MTAEQIATHGCTQAIDGLRLRVSRLEDAGATPEGQSAYEQHTQRINDLQDRIGKAEAVARTNYTVVQAHSGRLAVLENADDADGERIRQMQADLAGCKQLNEDIAGERDLLARKLRERTQERDDARANLERAKTHWSSCARDLDKAKRDLEDERGRCANLAESVTKLQRTLDKVAREREVLRDEMDHAHASVSALTRRIAEMEAALLAVGNAARIGTAHSLARACLGLVNGDEAVRIPDEKGRSS